MEKMNVALVGATGYGGKETLKILSKHPYVNICFACASDAHINYKIQNVFPELKNILDITLEKLDVDLISSKADVVLLATPNKIAMQIAHELIKNNIKVIDYSGDFRLKDLNDFETYYKTKHQDPDLNKSAVYGMPELFIDEIVNAELISNPGCFATSVILALAPLYKNNLVAEIPVINSITGTSGAGRKGLLHVIFSEAEGNVKPYKIGIHQHQPEINEVLSMISNNKESVLFAPMLGSFSRGILSSANIRFNTKISFDDLYGIYNEFYKDSPFIRLRDKGCYPEIKHVAFTNYCDIGFYSDNNKNAIIYSAIDNLVKGLSGQAIQNLNIMFGLDQTTGLI